MPSCDMNRSFEALEQEETRRSLDQANEELVKLRRALENERNKDVVKIEITTEARQQLAEDISARVSTKLAEEFPAIIKDVSEQFSQALCEAILKALSAKIDDSK